MSSKETTIKSPDEETAVVPAPPVRFPEFRAAGDWQARPLRKVATIITERVGDRNHTPLSITSGVGLLSQVEKFGRVIAGSQYRNYLCLQQGDFAYNKSATNDYPQGFIARYLGSEPAAVPNSIFTCFRPHADLIDGEYLNQLFVNNLHGRWLRRFMTVGARAHGSLNIDDADILAIPIPTPKHKLERLEQGKISECLSSLDNLISTERQKLDALKGHKKGLMQQLFPAEGEAVPRLRFPEFLDNGKWSTNTLSDIASIRSGVTPSRANPDFYGGGTIPWVKTTDLTNGFIDSTEECITDLAAARVNPPGSVLLAMYGGFNQIGRTGYLRIPAATNQAISVLNTDPMQVEPQFLLLWLNAKVYAWRRIASSSRKDPNITSSDVSRFPIAFPSLKEQSKIVEILGHLTEEVSAQEQRVTALAIHKRGLMQQLFPSLDEVQV